MPLSKSLRFSVFARDAFTCQYCGRRPPEVTLEVDHIHPVSRGGTDDSINLISSCYDCNRGKSAKIITEIAPRPDADLKSLRSLQEIAEAKHYLKVSRKLEKQRSMVIERLMEAWTDLISCEYVPSAGQWKTWLTRFTPEEIENGIQIASIKASNGSFGRDSQRLADTAIRYASGVMYQTRKQIGQVQ